MNTNIKSTFMKTEPRTFPSTLPLNYGGIHTTLQGVWLFFNLEEFT